MQISLIVGATFNSIGIKPIQRYMLFRLHYITEEVLVMFESKQLSGQKFVNNVKGYWENYMTDGKLLQVRMIDPYCAFTFELMFTIMHLLFIVLLYLKWQLSVIFCKVAVHKIWKWNNILRLIKLKLYFHFLIWTLFKYLFSTCCKLYTDKIAHTVFIECNK